MLFTNAASSKSDQVVQFNYRSGLGGIIGDEFDEKDAGVRGHIVRDVVIVSFTDLLDFAQAPPIMDYISLDVS